MSRLLRDIPALKTSKRSRPLYCVTYLLWRHRSADDHCIACRCVCCGHMTDTAWVAAARAVLDTHHGDTPVNINNCREDNDMRDTSFVKWSINIIHTSLCFCPNFQCGMSMSSWIPCLWREDWKQAIPTVVNTQITCSLRTCHTYRYYNCITTLKKNFLKARLKSDTWSWGTATSASVCNDVTALFYQTDAWHYHAAIGVRAGTVMIHGAWPPSITTRPIESNHLWWRTRKLPVYPGSQCWDNWRPSREGV